MRVQATVLAVLLPLAVADLSPRSARPPTIRGTVTDSTGAVVPGATVTVKGEHRLQPVDLTNASGVYSFPELPVGTYTVEVALTGFKSSQVRRASPSTSPTSAPSNVALETGAPPRTSPSRSPAVAVKTIGGEVAGLVTGEQVRELPLNGRNFLQLEHAHAGRERRATSFNTKDRGLMSGIRARRERQRPRRQHVDGGRRQQQRRGLQPHHPGVPLRGRDRGVQGPPQQLRRRVRRRRGRAGQHRHARRHERVPRQRLLLRAQRRARPRRTTS